MAQDGEVNAPIDTQVLIGITQETSIPSDPNVPNSPRMPFEGGCTLVGNIPVLVTGGATLSLGNNPFPNLGQSQNTLTLSPNAAVISVSGAAQVKQGP